MLRDAIGWASDIGGVLQFVFWIGAALAALVFWRSSRRRHRFTRVYFPVSREDFVNYYCECIRKARSAVYLTSDGFNMKNPESRSRAEQMAKSMEELMKRGGKVYRYQMVKSMHLNWLPEIVRITRLFPENFFTYYNPRMESVGNFCVIDPGTRRTVYEFMLPQMGYAGQYTEPSDFGFIHGHQHKSDSALRKFEDIRRHPDTVRITEENYLSIAESLWDERMARRDRDGVMTDLEIMTAKSPKFDPKVLE